YGVIDITYVEMGGTVVCDFQLASTAALNAHDSECPYKSGGGAGPAFCVLRLLPDSSDAEGHASKWRAGSQIMYGRHKSSWKQLSDARLECRAKEFIRIELELALTFVKVAHTKYSMRNVAGGD